MTIYCFDCGVELREIDVYFHKYFTKFRNNIKILRCNDCEFKSSLTINDIKQLKKYGIKI